MDPLETSVLSLVIGGVPFRDTDVLENSVLSSGRNSEPQRQRFAG